MPDLDLDEDMSLSEFDTESAPEEVEATPQLRVTEPPARPVADPDEEDIGSFLKVMGSAQETNIVIKKRPWMNNHVFLLVKTEQELVALVDQAIKVGRCALDTETQGLDTRVYWKKSSAIPQEDYLEVAENLRRVEGDDILVPTTVHKIVGYCLCYDGHTGYYVPVRHIAEDSGNIRPSFAAEQIRRLCLAAQPVLTESGKAQDPLSSREIAEPGKVRLLFWHAKYDQEMLYPVTGIDYWHPDSFEDGMLMYYCRLTSDKDLGLKEKAFTCLHTKEGYPYEMIELKELFVSASGKKREIKFATLHPEESTIYGCSDGICTFLLCELPENREISTGVVGDRDSNRRRKLAMTLMYRLEKQVVQVVRALERTRIHVDTTFVRQLIKEGTDEAGELEAKVKEKARVAGFPDFDIRSSSQTSDLLFSERGLDLKPKPEKNEKSGQYKTGADVLEELAKVIDNPIFRDIVKFRQIDKVLGTYLQNMVDFSYDPAGGKKEELREIRYQFKQTGTDTGRFSAPAGQVDQGYAGVPIHGIPAGYDEKKPKVALQLRKIFKARPGFVMVKVDFAGEELRIVTNLSQEPVWVDEFTHGTGDLHSITARAFFNKQEVTPQERKQGKCVHPDTVVFANGGYTTVSDLGAFPAEEGCFSPTSGKIYDGLETVNLTSLYTGGVKPLVHVVISGGLVTCTPQHRFLLRDGTWKEAGDLQPGDLLVESPMPPLGDNPYPELTFSLWEGVPPTVLRTNKHLSYFAGAFAGDGTSTDSCVKLTHGVPGKIDSFGNDFENWVASLEESSRLAGMTTTRKYKDSLYLGSTVVSKFMVQVGLHFGKRKSLRIPSWIWTQGKEAAMHFLAGLFDTDGTVSGGSSPNLDWVSKDFVFGGQVSTLLKACGLSFNTELMFNRTYQKYYIRLRLTVASSWAMNPYMRHPGKKSRMRPPIWNGHTKDRYKVLQILPAGEGPCLDLSVENERHQYQANGFVTHNTANFALLYGGGAAAVVRATKCSQIEGQRRKENFDKALPKFAHWVKNQKAFAHKEKGIYTAFGRWIAIPDIDNQDKKVVAGAERNSVNSPIQGCLQGSARVLTRGGYLPVQDLPESVDVWTGTQWAVAQVLDMGQCQAAKIRLSDGTTIACDTRHKQLIVTPEGYQWVDFQDLKVGMCSATPLNRPVEFEAPPLPEMGKRLKSKVIPKIPNLFEFWYWMGRYVGDGWLDPRGAWVCTFGDHEQEDITECVAFWESCGLNPKVRTDTHTPCRKESTRHRVEVWSVDLFDWLGALGFSPSTAHTKRIPSRVFQETLEHRKSFLHGVMESDGCYPPVEGGGNPYNVHLCQRPLLEDLKDLLRTVGVESSIQGPYLYKSQVSYRLDIQRRMYDAQVSGIPSRLPVFKDQFAPDFLVQEFLAKGPWKSKDFSSESFEVLYHRLKAGGKVTVYTLDEMCRSLGVELSQPIYGHKRIESIEVEDRQVPTYTLAVADELHRFEADGVITKNCGADIMKIAMVLLHREFFKRRWLPTQDDKVRMLLTVHDELVFEVANEVIESAMDLILDKMTEPGRMARWSIPLVAEPLIDTTWDAHYNWEHIMHGQAKVKKFDPNLHVEFEGRVYERPPEFLDPYVTPPWRKAGVVPPPIVDRPKEESPKVAAEPTKTATTKEPAPKGAQKGVAKAPSKPPPADNIAVFPIAHRNLGTVKQVLAACLLTEDPNGPYLHLIDASTQETLIAPEMGIRVNRMAFDIYLKGHNL